MSAGARQNCRPGCSVGGHEALDAIETDLAAGMPLRVAAVKYRLSKSALSRHVHNCGRRDDADPPPRRSRLNRQVEDRIVSYVKGGAYAWVAAQAGGVSARTFQRWMEKGAADDEAGYTRSPFRRFWMRVTEAHAQARARAELLVSRDQPLQWLRYGPGRNRPNEPGWTDSSQEALDDNVPEYVLVFNSGKIEARPAELSPVIDTERVRKVLPATADRLDEQDKDDDEECPPREDLPQ